MIIKSAASLLLVALSVSSTLAAESSFPVTDISIAEQNAMMKDYCVICHLDSSMNGGLSLEHFDAATVSPPLAAILANKFTMGVPLENLLEPELDPEVIEEIELGKRFGAPSVMGVAGLPLPSDGEINGFIMAMAQRTEGAERWHVNVDEETISADIVRITSFPAREDQRPRDIMFRLVLTCDLASDEGEMLLTWSPQPANGSLEVVVDNDLPVEFIIDEQEPMANGDEGTSAPSSVVLVGLGKKDEYPDISPPRNRLRLKSPLLSEQIEFSFADLWESEPDQLNACFAS